MRIYERAGESRDRLDVSDGTFSRMRPHLMALLLGTTPELNRRSYRFSVSYVQSYHTWRAEEGRPKGLVSLQDYSETERGLAASNHAAGEFYGLIGELAFRSGDDYYVDAANFAEALHFNEQAPDLWRRQGYLGVQTMEEWRGRRIIALTQLRRFCTFAYPLYQADELVPALPEDFSGLTSSDTINDINN